MVSKQAQKAKTKTVSAPVVEKVVEEPIETKSEISGYVVPILFQREPIDKDIPAADVFYRKFANLIEIQCHRPNFHSQLEMITAGDISLLTEAGGIVCISKSESPVSWITNLYKSREFSGNPFIAREAQEIYEI